MARNKMEYELLNKIKDDIGDRFSVTPAFASASIEGLANSPKPDIILSDDNNLFIIEVKNSAARNDLPLSTAHITQRLREANSQFDPKIILVTSSKIGPILNDELKSQGVTVINNDNIDEISREINSIVLK